MKRTHVIAGVIAAAALLIGTVAAARGPHGGGMDGRMNGRMMQALDLSADQTQQVTALRQQMQATVKPLRDDMKALHEQMRELWKAAAPDRAAILQLHAEIDAVRAKIQVTHIDFRLAVHAILTPAQRTKAAEQMDKKGSRRGGRGLGGPGCGFGGPGCGFGPGGSDADLD